MVTTATGIATSYIQFTRGSNATVTNNVGNIAWAGHNLLTNSESFDASAWIKAGSAVTANATVAPNGTTTADKLLELGGTSFHGLYQGGGALTSIPVTFSVFVKGDLGRDWVRISYDGGGSKTAWFNVTNGTIGTVNAGLTTLPPQLVGNGFYLIQISFTGAASGNVAIGPAISDGVDSYAGDASKGVTIWGASLYRSDLGGMVFNPAQPAGLGTYYPTTPPNLLGYTEDWTNAYWVKTGLLAFGSGSVANSTLAPNGLQTADLIIPDTSTGFHFTKGGSAITAPTNTPYTYSVYVKPFGYTKFALRETVTTGVYSAFSLVGGGSVIDKSASATATIIALSGGWYRITMTVAVAAASIGLGLYPLSPSYTSGVVEVSWTPNGSEGFYLWGAQLSDSASIDPYSPVYGAAVTSSAYYAPRLDYSPTTIQPLGMLVEEQRTNLRVNSATSVGSIPGTVLSTGNSSPDGANAANGFTEDTSAVERIVGGFNLNQNQTISFFVRRTAGSSVRYVAILATNVVAGGAFFNLAAGTAVTNSSSDFTAQITPIGSYWRCSVTRVNAVAQDLSLLITEVNTPYSGSKSYTGDGVSKFLFWGFQLEAGSFPTSYIPTGASTVTRSADNASVSTQAFPYGSTEGTLVANGSFNTGIDIAAYLVQLGGPASGTGYGSSHSIFRGGASAIDVGQRLKGITYDDANSETGSCVTAGNINVSPSKVAYGFAVNNFAASVNGASVITDSSGAMPTASTIMTLGAIRNGGGYYINGHIRQITYLPRRISNAELQTRST